MVCRLADLNSKSREKRENGRYLRMNFVMPVVVLAVLWLTTTIVFMAK